MIRKSIKSSQLAFMVNAFNEGRYKSDLDFYETEVKGNENDFINKCFNEKGMVFEYIFNPDITEMIIANEIKQTLKSKNMWVSVNSSLSSLRREIVSSFEVPERNIYLLKDYSIRFSHEKKNIELKFSLSDINEDELYCDRFSISINGKEENFHVKYYWLMLVALAKI
ncbi:hypothetical protein SS41_23205 [Enterobacter hormaechei subsp. xiangfangensis]|uniref:hypothetical protein n=1 Tax=Enterobacter hormaechei TaxID=158836 RepID=UPI0005ED44E2|nr:hypothetical protein [Enterobacter hormaechei]KJN19165.1 hypothetical protein SS41_23205 [Enterobacter hormaechei subsp. xiangfangensis]